MHICQNFFNSLKEFWSALKILNRLVGQLSFSIVNQKKIVPCCGMVAYHRIHECCQSCLLRGCQAIPFSQHLTLCGSQSHTNVVLRKELRQCNTESIADLLKRCKRWCHRLFIPRGDGRLWQARAFSKLIFRPSPCLTISFDDFQNICHNFTALDFSFIILWKIVAF